MSNGDVAARLFVGCRPPSIGCINSLAGVELTEICSKSVRHKHAELHTNKPIHHTSVRHLMRCKGIWNGVAAAWLFGAWMLPSIEYITLLDGVELTEICLNFVRQTHAELHTKLPIHYTCIRQLMGISNWNADFRLFVGGTPPSIAYINFLDGVEVKEICFNSVRHTHGELHTNLPIHHKSMWQLMRISNRDVAARLFVG